MSEYYLIPRLWKPNGSCNQHEIIESGEGIRIISTNSKKAQKAAESYQRELNNGELFDIEKVAKEQIEMWDVLSIPFYQARDYNTFWKWPCNNEH